jgi:hypothetical protein
MTVGDDGIQTSSVCVGTVTGSAGRDGTFDSTSSLICSATVD